MNQGCPWDAGPCVGSRSVADAVHDLAPPWLSVLICKMRMRAVWGSREAVSMNRWIYAQCLEQHLSMCI